MKYLITGGAGFIGSNIARKLIEDGEHVRVLDNFSSGKEENLVEIINDIELIEGDIRDYWTVSSTVKGMDYVLHQAALPSVPKSILNPLSANAVNIDGTLNVLEASRLAGVKRFVMASSSAVYGESVELPKHEGIIPSPLSPYAVAKLTNEYYCKVYNDLYKLPTVALRYFNIFGPRQDPKSEYAPVIPRFITLLHSGQKPTIYGDGEQSRDFIYIDNAVEANLLAARNPALSGQVFNVANGFQCTLNQLLERLRQILGVNLPAEYAPAREGDIRHSYASIEKLKSYGFNGSVGLDEGLQRTVAFFTAPSTTRTHISR
ncbi:MAG: SDR family oxidoreductase [candidate division Zixibacteria bacterium]|nr:SDR family oxidoreductase [candidate division Zixibacteria bacterium]